MVHNDILILGPHTGATNTKKPETGKEHPDCSVRNYDRTPITKTTKCIEKMAMPECNGKICCVKSPPDECGEHTTFECHLTVLAPCVENEA